MLEQLESIELHVATLTKSQDLLSTFLASKLTPQEIMSL